MNFYPQLQQLPQTRSMQTQFNGYNHNISCGENEFYDMQNMTSNHFPLLSPREKRGICKQLTNPQGILDKESMFIVDGANLYNDGNLVTLASGVTISTDEDMRPKSLAKMGAYVIIMPDKIWYNAENNTSGYMYADYKNYLEDDKDNPFDLNISFADSYGNSIIARDESYYADHSPIQGDYKITKVNGKSVLQQYSSSTSMWVNVATTYLKISCTGIGAKFEKGDGVTITLDNTTAQWQSIGDVFVNDLGNNKHSTKTVIEDKTDDTITIVGIIPSEVSFDVATNNGMPMTVEREVPDMLYITECQNRLWGCSTDGHTIYASKLGDCRNWNVFQGNSLDSWSVPVGTDGQWTGAITFLGYPTFFKEDSMTRISISGNNLHATKDTILRGVMRGSEKSLCIVNEVLYYNSVTGIVAFDGSLPVSVSDAFGGVRFSDAVGGTINNKYYVSMKDEDNKVGLYVYDTQKGFWHKEDDTQVLYFCRQKDELYFIDSVSKQLKSVRGTLPYEVEEATTEPKFKWFAETGNIGYEYADQKYISRYNIRVSAEKWSSFKLYIKYDSEFGWEEIFSHSADGIRSFTIPMIPRRCDHFKWRIEGTGDVKVLSVAKITEQGSDIICNNY